MRNRSGFVPEDLVLEILLKIPARWVVGLRCVCKSWNALIIDPQFATRHFDRNKNTKHILYIDFSNRLRQKSLSFFRVDDDDDEQPHTLYDIRHWAPRRLDFAQNPNFPDFFRDCVLSGSINGIICLSSFRNSPHAPRPWVALWNPSINHCKFISCPPPKPWDYMYSSISLAFDFLTNDYKIIRLVSLRLDKPTNPLFKSRIEIYSAKQDSWIEVDQGAPIPIFPTQPNSTVIVKGVPYWSRDYKQVDQFHQYRGAYFIAAIDPHTGLYKLIPYPPAVRKLFHSTVIPFNLMDSLALLIHSRGRNSNHIFHVSALDQTSATWNKLFTTTSTLLQNKNICIHRCFEDAGHTLVMGWNNDRRCSFVYDPKTDSLCQSIGMVVSLPIWDESYHHVESLFSINGMEPIPKEEDDNHERGVPEYWGREIPPLFQDQFATFAGGQGL